MSNTSVLMTSEGTYPFFKGGVSVWCDQLISSLSDIDFHVFAIVPSPRQPLVYTLPPNVVSCRPFPLWGTELPGPQEAVFFPTYLRRLRTSPSAIRERFVRPFRTVLRCFLVPGSDPEELAEALLDLHVYFGDHDYAETMLSPEAWSAFLDSCSSHLPRQEWLELEEATACMRWLLRYLAIVAVRYPEVDLVHSSMAGLAGVPGVLLKLLHGTPYLLTEHGIYLRELYLMLGRTGYSLRCKRFLLTLNEAIVQMNYHCADAVTSLGEFNRKWQIRLGVDAAKIVFVPNGADPEVFCPREPPPLPLTVLTMARIFPLKGIQHLLRAAVRVHARLPRVRFRILGEVADRDYFEQCLQLVQRNGLEEVVEFGETSDAPAAYRQAHVFCLPSVSEGMPYAVLEAMLCGRPVVATDVGNVADVLGGTGLLAKPNDPEDLARMLLRLLDGAAAESLRATLAARALTRARQTYTIRNSADRFGRLYQALSQWNVRCQSA
ncbi:MAG: GT4 family glycosyltransferase PelF [Acidobacteria bacterium]|nr:GT4 family glycosyltransferase PelF [Acidobacteriota bacterium]